jgi:hypothetical protein
MTINGNWKFEREDRGLFQDIITTFPWTDLREIGNNRPRYEHRTSHIKRSLCANMHGLVPVFNRVREMSVNSSRLAGLLMPVTESRDKQAEKKIKCFETKTFLLQNELQIKFGAELA